MLFLDILAEFLAEDLFYNKVKDYLTIRKGDLKDSAFEKFYKTFVVAFVETHRWPDTQHAEKFFNDETTSISISQVRPPSSVRLRRLSEDSQPLIESTKTILCPPAILLSRTQVFPPSSVLIPQLSP